MIVHQARAKMPATMAMEVERPTAPVRVIFFVVKVPTEASAAMNWRALTPVESLSKRGLPSELATGMYL
mgnify:CR=1 FL=1